MSEKLTCFCGLISILLSNILFLMNLSIFSLCQKNRHQQLLFRNFNLRGKRKYLLRWNDGQAFLII